MLQVVQGGKEFCSEKQGESDRVGMEKGFAYFKNRMLSSVVTTSPPEPDLDLLLASYEVQHHGQGKTFLSPNVPPSPLLKSPQDEVIANQV